MLQKLKSKIRKDFANEKKDLDIEGEKSQIQHARELIKRWIKHPGKGGRIYDD
jgi:hypothetical protein